ncbi:MAG TPA: fused MFS/spermidine synthase [Patescibacteria group bacterium]|nr:fused MFS/spermidine synthase [Patescibacteria group bacterium]
MKVNELLSGTRVLYQDKKWKVIKDFAWGTYIQSGGLTQSGGIVTKIWKETLKKVIDIKPVAENILILGLGGGSAAKLVSQYWVNSKITGVDINKKIVELGKKYLKLDENSIGIQIQDAYGFILTTDKKYDLILVDLYNGDKFPEEFESEKFIKSVKSKLTKGGIVVFNRLYGADRRTQSMKFGRVLEKYFKKVDYIIPMANVDFVCYN